MDEDCIPSRKKVCASREQINKQVDQLKLFKSWSGYPSDARNSFLKRLKNNAKNSNKLDEKIIWIRLPHFGEKGDQMKRNYFGKVKRHLKEVIFRTFCVTKMFSIFCSSKGQIPTYQSINLI